MTIKIFCDRCGNSMGLEGEKEIKTASSIKLTQPLWDHDHYKSMSSQKLDICPNCIEAFRAWLKEPDGP